MIKLLAFLTTLAGFSLGLTVRCHAQDPKPSVTILGTFDFPRANGTETLVGGINDRGVIVGSYFAPETDNFFGYSRLADGTFKTIIDVGPPRYYTFPLDINNSGITCGNAETSQGNEGFLYDGKTFTLYAVPGSDTTTIEGINNAGDFVGNFEMAGVRTGFANIGGNLTFIAVPDATLTEATGINDHDEIVGFYYDSTGSYGFYQDATGNMTYPITVKGSNFVGLSAINAKGQIVGEWSDPRIGGYSHGFVLTLPHHIVSFDVPGSYSTTTSGINNSGEISGGYGDYEGRGMHGFIGQLNE